MEWTDENTELYYIEEELFNLMWETDMYEKLSSIDGVMFDDYESDCIPDECLPRCIELLESSEQFKDTEWTKAFKAGLKYGYGIYTEF